MVASRARGQKATECGAKGTGTPNADYIPGYRANNGDYGTKPWIESQIITIAKAAINGRPAKVDSLGGQVAAIPRNHALALTALMSLAKLKGYIVEKRSSLSAKLDLSKMQPAELRAALDGALDQLAPGERQKLLKAIEQDGLTLDASVDDIANSPE